MKAPYEEEEVPSKTFDVEVSYLIRKKTTVNTNDYDIERDDFERQAFLNTELTDWKSAYEESHFTIKEMLSELRRYVENEMCNVLPSSHHGRRLKRLLDDVQGWEVVESEFVEQ